MPSLKKQVVISFVGKMNHQQRYGKVLSTAAETETALIFPVSVIDARRYPTKKLLKVLNITSS